MQLTQQDFYGREKEIRLLFDAWLQAHSGKPQWVSLVAETGTGKTRLVQEFYRYISDLSYRTASDAIIPNDKRYQVDFNAEKYWPKNLPLEQNKLGLNPDPDGLSDEKIESLKDIPWLWWGIRGENPGRRNPSEGGCAAKNALSHLELHTTILAVQRARAEANLDAAKAIGKWALTKIPVAGPMFEMAFTMGELIHSGKRPFETLLSGVGVRLPEERNKLQIKFQDLLVDSTFKFLEQGVPVILILDDAHWFDADTVAFVDRLVAKVSNRSLKLMIISTSWAREWDQAEIRHVFERFPETRQLRSLGGIEAEHARALLLAHFSGLTEEDQTLLTDRANGSFGYLTELVLALKEEADRFFADENTSACLTASGRERIGSEVLEMDQLVKKRFSGLEKNVRKALMRSSYQGARFDPRLTSMATQIVEPEASDQEASTLDAINKAERPGAMVCSVEDDLREFLQGPYWRLIRQRQEEQPEELATLGEAYRKIIMQGQGSAPDSIAESLVAKWLEAELDRGKRMQLRGWLLEVAARDHRFQAGLRHLSALATEYAEANKVQGSGEPINSRSVAIAALRVFNQFAFGAGTQQTRESLEQLCIQLASGVLQAPIMRYLQDGSLPEGGDLPELIESCEVLVSFRQALGHMHDYRIWLTQLCELQKNQLKSDSVTPGQRFRHAATLLNQAEAEVPMAEDRGDWDRVFDVYQRALAQINLLEGRENRILWASCQISVLYFASAGRRHYPEVPDWGNDYQGYYRCAESLGNLLSEIERQEKDASNNWFNETSSEVMEVLLHGATLTIEYARHRNHLLATEFLDRLRLLTRWVFERIQSASHVPTSLAHAAMEADLAVMSMLSRLATRSETPDCASESEPPSVPGMVVLRLKSRGVGASEALQAIEQIIEAVSRYRELGMLSVDMLRIFAQISHEKLLLTAAGTDAAADTFSRIVTDAVLAKDGERAAFGEPVRLLDWLIRIFDRWLANAPDADMLWKALRDAYSPCSERQFGGLVEIIRSQLANDHDVNGTELDVQGLDNSLSEDASLKS